MTDTIANLDAARAKGLGQQEAWPDPDWSILQDAMPAAPTLPIETFGIAADYLKRAAHGANVAPDYPAAMLFAAAGALVGKLYSVRVASDWFEPLSLWSVMVGPPSSGKTPAGKPIRKHLHKLQLAFAERHRLECERELAHAEADNVPAYELERLRHKIDQPPRFIVNDSTSEALARIEARSPRGLLVERDELAGLIEGLERYSAGVDRAFYLEGWNDGPFTLDRVKAGTITIPDHCLSITGGIQPDRFRSLLTHTGDDDGFCARLLIFWPDALPPGPIPNGADHAALHRALNRISGLPAVEPTSRHILKISADGYSALNEWFQTEHAARKQVTGKRGSAFGKLPGYAARIAGCQHLLDWAFGYGETLPDEIEKTHILAALVLIETYFVPQIERAYHGADRSPEEQIAGALLHEAARRKVQLVNLRTARREWGLAGARSKEATTIFKGAGELLIDSSWFRKSPRQGGASDFAVNPALFGERSQ